MYTLLKTSSRALEKHPDTAGVVTCYEISLFGRHVKVKFLVSCLRASTAVAPEGQRSVTTNSLHHSVLLVTYRVSVRYVSRALENTQTRLV